MGGRPLLHGLSFDVEGGRFDVILGPSGCGKSTLLRTLAGLHEASAGVILVDGRDVTHVPAHERGVVLVHQEDTLFPHLDVQANIAFGPRLRHRDARETAATAKRLLELVGLGGFERRRVDTLSGGERQRVALARALAVEPNVILLDEPFSALDRSLRETLRRDVRRITKEAGATVLFVTHDREEAFGLADSLLLVRDGQIVDRGSPIRVFTRPATLQAAKVLGRRNLYRVTAVRDDDADTAFGSIPVDHAPPDAAWLLVNEEDVDLSMGGEDVVSAVEFQGARVLCRIRRGAGELVVDAPAAAGFKPQDRVTVRWNPQRHVVWPDEGKSPQS